MFRGFSNTERASTSPNHWSAHIVLNATYWWQRRTHKSNHQTNTSSLPNIYQYNFLCLHTKKMDFIMFQSSAMGEFILEWQSSELAHILWRKWNIINKSKIMICNWRSEYPGLKSMKIPHLQALRPHSSLQTPGNSNAAEELDIILKPRDPCLQIKFRRLSFFSFGCILL